MLTRTEAKNSVTAMIAEIFGIKAEDVNVYVTDLLSDRKGSSYREIRVNVALPDDYCE